MTRPQPIQRISFQAWSHAATHWVIKGQRELFVLDAPYQRGLVWTVEQRRNMLESLLRGLPIGSIVYNRRDHGHLHYIVDGVQRISAIQAFFDDGFTVPAWWFEDDELTVPADGDALFSQLSIIGQRRVQMLPMPSLEANVATVEEEARIFDLINTAGTAQTTQTIAKARAIAAGAR
jgi:hypothetical protein